MNIDIDAETKAHANPAFNYHHKLMLLHLHEYYFIFSLIQTLHVHLNDTNDWSIISPSLSATKFICCLLYLILMKGMPLTSFFPPVWVVMQVLLIWIQMVAGAPEWVMCPLNLTKWAGRGNLAIYCNKAELEDCRKIATEDGLYCLNRFFWPPRHDMQHTSLRLTESLQPSQPTGHLSL